MNKTITRLRELRGLYRSNAKALTTTNAELEEKIKLLTMTAVKEEAILELLDSDIEESEQPVKLEITKKTPIIASTTSTPIITPTTTIAITRNNKKYPNMPYFYGDKEQQDEWRFHLDSKFRQSAVLFPTEKDKMDYIRDHSKSITFDVLKARADPLSEDPYTSAKEMISELYSMFGDYDKLAKCNAMLHNPAFGIGVKKKKELFDDFYIRFSATIAPIGFSDSHKIAILRRLITIKL